MKRIHGWQTFFDLPIALASGLPWPRDCSDLTSPTRCPILIIHMETKAIQSSSFTNQNPSWIFGRPTYTMVFA